MRFALWLAVAIFVAATTTVASAADKPMCNQGFEEGRRLMAAHQLLAARSALIPCAQDECSKPARTRCADALREVQKAIPSIIVRAKTKGSARLLIDGKIARENLDGEPIELDPGEHTIRVEPDGIEQRVTIAQGVQRREIEIGARDGKRAATSKAGVWKPSPLGILALVISGGAFAAGIATGVFAVVRADDCGSGLCNNALVDEGLRTAHASTAMFVVAALGAAVGAVTLVILSPKASAQGAVTTGRVQLELGGSACALSIAF